MNYRYVLALVLELDLFPALLDELSSRCFLAHSSHQRYILGTMTDQTVMVLADNHASNFLHFIQVGILGKFRFFAEPPDGRLGYINRRLAILFEVSLSFLRT